MSDLEFDVLDELYFVISFDALRQETGLSITALRDCLKGLFEKKWVKCFRSMSEELLPEEVDFEKGFQRYFYLATKSGLLAHNRA